MNTAASWAKQSTDKGSVTPHKRVPLALNNMTTEQINKQTNGTHPEAAGSSMAGLPLSLRLKTPRTHSSTLEPLQNLKD